MYFLHGKILTNKFYLYTFYSYIEKIAIIIRIFSMIIKEMYVNSNHIDITMIIIVKICPFI